MDEKLSKQLNVAISAVFIIAAGLLVWSAVNRQPSDESADDLASATSTPQVDSTPEYDAASSLASVTIAKNFESWTPDAKLEPAKTRTATVAVEGQVAKAYLVVKASEGANALTEWDSYYFKIGNTGGHLFRPMSLPVPSEENKTVLLYDLSDIPYLASVPYSEDRTPEKSNMIELFKPGRNVLVTTFISSLRQSTIEEATITYGCADGSECKLTVTR